MNNSLTNWNMGCKVGGMKEQLGGILKTRRELIKYDPSWWVVATNGREHVGEHDWAVPISGGEEGVLLFRVNGDEYLDMTVEVGERKMSIRKVWPKNGELEWEVKLTMEMAGELGGVLSEVGELMQKLTIDQKRATALWPVGIR
jgi:hypothetical protein